MKCLSYSFVAVCRNSGRVLCAFGFSWDYFIQTPTLHEHLFYLLDRSPVHLKFHACILVAPINPQLVPT
jgi:hypothetical protein